MAYLIRTTLADLPIETGVPIPPPQYGRPKGPQKATRKSWPFKDMQVGDSVLDTTSIHSRHSQAYNAAKAYQTLTDGAMVFVSRSMDATETHPAGLRIWRTK